MPMMMGNKSFVQVLLNDKGQAVEPKKDESVNPDAGLEQATSELVKAVHEKDSKRALRVLKAIVRACMDEYESEEEDFDGMKYSEAE